MNKCYVNLGSAPGATKTIYRKTYFVIPPTDLLEWITYAQPSEQRLSGKGIFAKKR